MNLKEIYIKNNSPVVSYEVFPPKDDIDGTKLELLFEELSKLMLYKPSLISVTYGAGGANQTESYEIIKRIKNDLQVLPMPHFTCVSTSKNFIKEYLTSLENIGIGNILALRGDIPEDRKIYHDFKFASDLVQYIKAESKLSVAVAGYPEGHKEAVSLQKDIEFLKYKIDFGADVVYTQLFFNNDKFFSFIEKCHASGINIPIIPGILPVTNYKTLEKMAMLCKVEIPKRMAEKLEKHSDDKDYIKQYGIEYATNQCAELIKSGVRGLHFYTLNKSFAVSGILSNLLNTRTIL